MRRSRPGCGWVWAAIAIAARGAGAVDVPADGNATLELVDGSTVAGVVRSIDAAAAEIDTASGLRRLPLAEVRRLVREPRRPAGAAPRMQVEAVDGTTVAGDDFRWQGVTATIVREGATIELPIERVRRVTWPIFGEPAPAWHAALPDDPAKDLVVVSSGESVEVVDCAITAVSAEAVTVVLDEETIPVRRGKVLGLVWSRPAAAETGVRIAVDAGRLTGRAVRLEGDDLVVDDATRVPFAIVESIDFAAARSVALCDLEPERRTTEPFVGDLAGISGVAAFFAPRVVPAAAGSAAAVAGGRTLVVRPRTAASWRVPAAARRFHAVVARGSGGRREAVVRVAVRLDDHAAWETVLDPAHAAEAAVDLDVAGAARLELLVDFVGLDPGCPVLIGEAAFER